MFPEESVVPCTSCTSCSFFNIDYFIKTQEAIITGTQLYVS